MAALVQAEKLHEEGKNPEESTEPVEVPKLCRNWISLKRWKEVIQAKRISRTGSETKFPLENWIQDAYTKLWRDWMLVSVTFTKDPSEYRYSYHFWLSMKNSFKDFDNLSNHLNGMSGDGNELVCRKEKLRLWDGKEYPIIDNAFYTLFRGQEDVFFKIIPNALKPIEMDKFLEAGVSPNGKKFTTPSAAKEASDEICYRFINDIRRTVIHRFGLVSGLTIVEEKDKDGNVSFQWKMQENKFESPLTIGNQLLNLLEKQILEERLLAKINYYREVLEQRRSAFGIDQGVLTLQEIRSLMDSQVCIKECHVEWTDQDRIRFKSLLKYLDTTGEIYYHQHGMTEGLTEEEAQQAMCPP